MEFYLLEYKIRILNFTNISFQISNIPYISNICNVFRSINQVIGVLIMAKQKPFKLISLISGGIDSPVATYLMLSRGADIAALYFDSRPFIDKQTRTKVINLIDRLKQVTKINFKLFIIPHGNNQTLIVKRCDRHLSCILCRRMMLRLAELVGRKERAIALITGDSLGQVASQTLQNIYVESQAVDMPIIRPLIGLDKIEIERIARKIGTYEISIGPGLCCTIVPSKPSTNAALKRILHEEEKLDIDSMVKDSIEKMEVL